MSVSCFDYETPRLVFEPLGAGHGALLFPALSSPLVSQYLSCDPPVTVDELSEQFERMAAGPPEHGLHEQWLNFAVQRREDGRWIGRVEATVRPDWAEVAYLFGPFSWGRGYASESLAWLHRNLRFNHGVRACWATVAPANARSIRLLMRSGYRRASIHDAPPLDSFDSGDAVFRIAIDRQIV